MAGQHPGAARGLPQHHGGRGVVFTGTARIAQPAGGVGNRGHQPDGDGFGAVRALVQPEDPILTVPALAGLPNPRPGRAFQ